MITLKSIRTVSSSPSYTRGNQLYKQRKVLDFEKTEDREMLYLSANVIGSTEVPQAINTMFISSITRKRRLLRTTSANVKLGRPIPVCASTVSPLHWKNFILTLLPDRFP